ncbi:MAG: hypothetical protein GF311_10070 [Candidatus Lokiarchaeota archaeon]|nr:hypothetical protein [Candidatus Lokiarchaeota archaeon]
MEKYLKKQGSYTNRKFWKAIITYQKTKKKSKDEIDFKKEHIMVSNSKDFRNGFEQDYYQLFLKSNFVSDG